MDEPSAHGPWGLVGESVVTLVARRGSVLGVIGEGLVSLSGPALVIAANYHMSPIGPFCELSVLEPVRHGARPGWSVTLSVVNDARARSGARLSWGIDRGLGALVWRSDGAAASLSWEERGLIVAGERRRGAVPLSVSVRALQRRGDGPVNVPLRLRGLAHRARVSVEVGADDPLGVIAGVHRGVTVSGGLHISPAYRSCAAVPKALVAPLRHPEPGTPAPGLAHHGS